MACVSVIATVYNEGESIRRLLESLVAQTRPPDEVVICDGGSRDETIAIVEDYRDRLPNLRVVVEFGANISRGRNIAIEAAHGPLIAATDAGVRLAPDWLEKLVAPLEETEEDAGQEEGENKPATCRLFAVAGFFLPDIAGTFETAMAATVLPLVTEIDPVRFLPSSRSVAFRKEAWRRAGGYPEWLDYCEDLIFDIRLNGQVPQRPNAFAWAPQAVAYFRPRSSLSTFWIQYYRYARGDGKADLWRKRHIIRYVTYGILLPGLLGHALWGFFARWLGWLGLLAGAIAYCVRPWLRLHRLGKELAPGEWLRAAALVPVIRIVGDLAKMAGYPVGLLWRWRNRQRSEIYWR